MRIHSEPTAFVMAAALVFLSCEGNVVQSHEDMALPAVDRGLQDMTDHSGAGEPGPPDVTMEASALDSAKPPDATPVLPDAPQDATAPDAAMDGGQDIISPLDTSLPAPDSGCTSGAVKPCYTGAAGTKGVGECKAGTNTCTGGAWGVCKGQVVPSKETCDGKDNDCDGEADEALTQLCCLPGVSAANSGKQNRAALAAIMKKLPSGGTLCFPAGTFKIAGTWTVDRACSITGAAGAHLKFSGDPAGVVVTKSKVSITGLEIEGPQHSKLAGAQFGIYLKGKGSPSTGGYLTGIKVKSNYIHNWGTDGIHARFVKSSELGSGRKGSYPGYVLNPAEGNRIRNVHRGGMYLICVKDMEVNHNVINKIVNPSKGNSYGITLSGGPKFGSAGAPACSNVRVLRNTITDIPMWVGLDTHGGNYIYFDQNLVRDCAQGIAVSYYDATTVSLPPLPCS